MSSSGGRRRYQTLPNIKYLRRRRPLTKAPLQQEDYLFEGLFGGQNFLTRYSASRNHRECLGDEAGVGEPISLECCELCCPSDDNVVDYNASPPRVEGRRGSRGSPEKGRVEGRRSTAGALLLREQQQVGKSIKASRHETDVSCTDEKITGRIIYQRGPID